MLGKTLTPVQSGLTALTIAFMALVPLYKACVWAFIRYWESQSGVRMKFIFWAELRAFPTALVLSALVFVGIFCALQRGVPKDKRVAAWKVATATIGSVVLLFLGLVSYVQLR